MFYNTLAFPEGSTLIKSSQARLGRADEGTEMPTMYAKCNWMLSLAMDENGQPCKYLAKAESGDGVLADMSNHVRTVHNIDPSELINNIKAVTKTVRTKPLGTRAPGAH